MTMEKQEVPADQFKAASKALAPGNMRGIKPAEESQQGDPKPTPEPPAPETPDATAPKAPESEDAGDQAAKVQGSTSKSDEAPADAGKPKDEGVADPGSEAGEEPKPAAEELEALDGVRRRKEADGTIRYLSKSDGEEVWQTLSEMRDTSQSIATAQKRLREARERTKAIEAKEQELTEREKQLGTTEDGSMAGILKDFLGPDAPERADDLSDESPVVRQLTDQVKSLTEAVQTVQGRFSAADQQQEQTEIKVRRDAAIQGAFRMVGELLTNAGIETPDKALKVEDRVLLNLATEAGGYDTDRFFELASNPQRVMTEFKSVHGFRPASPPPPNSEADGSETPPKSPIPSAVTSTATPGGLASLEKERTALEETLASGKLSPGQLGKFGARLQTVNSEIAKLGK